jgi:hypothetical protein
MAPLAARRDSAVTDEQMSVMTRQLRRRAGRRTNGPSNTRDWSQTRGEDLIVDLAHSTPS